MKLKTGDEIYSVHSFNTFRIEYVSSDGNSFVLVSSDGKYKVSRCYTLPDIKRSFKKCKVSNIKLIAPMTVEWRRVAELEAENARLRQQRDAANAQLDFLIEEVKTHIDD